MAALVVALPMSGIAQERWVFKVCAQPYNYPASSRDRPGFENKIAEILADELGAELVFEWTIFSDAAIERTLHTGACDAIIGIGDGVTEVESTVPFLRVPYTFVSREEDSIEVVSLDDPLLAELTIGTYPGGIPSRALNNRGLQDNVREYAPVASPNGFDRDTAILNALIDGEVDVAIVFGLAAAARAEAEPGILRITPVSPELDAGTPFLQMFRTFTIGVRPYDVNLRERLDFSLAARWEEIQAVIASYGVHQLDITQPPVAPKSEPGTISVGVVVPSETAAFHAYEVVGRAARRGAEFAENYVALRMDRLESQFRVVIASAPSDEAAVRAAERLAATEDVLALVGGFGRVQAEKLSQIAEERNLVFFNVGAADEVLRGRLCRRSTFHIEASTSMYADAAIAWFAARGKNEWYLLYEQTEDGEALAQHVRETLATVYPESSLVGETAVTPGQLVYVNEIKAIHDAAPDIVLVQLAADEKTIFFGQLERQGIRADVTIVPSVLNQSREFFYRLGQTAPNSSTSAWPALWEASVEEGEVGDINEAYTSRTGDPMEPSAWATYAAVLLTFEAASADAAGDAVSLIEFLSDPEATFDLGKGDGVSFRQWDHQLRQPLYMVQTNPDASWGRRASSRRKIMEAVGIIPDASEGEDQYTLLDHLGMSRERSECQF